MSGSHRGQAGVERLLAFIVVVTAVLVVVPALFGMAGVDIRNSSLGGAEEAADEEVPEGSLLVLSSAGAEINDDRTSIGVVELVVTTSGEPVDLEDLTIIWDDEYQLTPSRMSAGDASFAIETVRDNRTLADSGDRAFLRIDLGTDDVEDLQRFGDRLQPGDTVTVTLRTGAGVETRETLSVPNPLPAGSVVRLR